MKVNKMNYLFKVLNKNLLNFIISILTSLVLAVVSIYLAFASQNMVDSTKDNFTVNMIVLISVITSIILLNAINTFFQSKNTIKIEKMIRLDLYENIFNKDYETISKVHSGKIMNYLTSDVSVVSSTLATLLPQVVLMVTKLVLGMVVITYILPILGLFFIFVGILGFALSFVFRKKLKALHKNVQEAEGNVRAYYQESIESMLIIKSFKGEKATFKKAYNKQTDSENIQIKKLRFSTSINACLNLVFRLAYALTIVYAVWCLLYDEGLITYGTILALIQLVAQIRSPLVSLSGTFSKYYSMIASADRIIEIINLKEDEVIERLSSYEFDKIIAEDLSFKYDDFEVINSSSFTLNKGDFVLIKGSSGIGKSTLLKLLLGLYEAKEGSLIIKQDDNEIKISKGTRGLFSYVPQGNFVFSGTIKENLTFFKTDVSYDDIHNALVNSCALDFIEKLDDGIDTVIGERGLGLSEGQIQRLAIARALLNNKPILLLDEATSALDLNTEIKLLENLKKMKDLTCIIVTHKDASKEICNKELDFVDSTIICKE